jgi:hypothetical protein
MKIISLNLQNKQFFQSLSHIPQIGFIKKTRGQNSHTWAPLNSLSLIILGQKLIVHDISYYILFSMFIVLKSHSCFWYPMGWSPLCRYYLFIIICFENEQASCMRTEEPQGYANGSTVYYHPKKITRRTEIRPNNLAAFLQVSKLNVCLSGLN